MKGNRKLLTGLVLGMVMGWALGFLRLPYIEKNHSFLLGFIAALALISLLIILLAARNRDFQSGLMGKKELVGRSNSSRRHTFLWILLGGVVLLGSLAGGLMVNRQMEAFQNRIQKQDKALQEMAEMVESLKQNDLEPAMRTILEEVGEELKRNPGRRLTDATITRIAAFSFSCKPYKTIEMDSLSEKAYSPGRGQLLQALALMKLDTGSFSRIKQQAHFTGADLRGAGLKGSDLSGINLQNSNLKDADLSGANLKGADLGGANLWGANLNQANLSNANLKRADLSWAQMNNATLAKANLNGATLTNTQLLKADLNNALFQWAHSGGAMFNEANLNSVSFLGTNLSKVNFRQANLSDSDLRKTDLSEADLLGVSINNTLVDGNWIEKLKQGRTSGVTELQESYTISNDTSPVDKRPLYRLMKKQ